MERAVERERTTARESGWGERRREATNGRLGQKPREGPRTGIERQDNVIGRERQGRRSDRKRERKWRE